MFDPENPLSDKLSQERMLLFKDKHVKKFILYGFRQSQMDLCHQMSSLVKYLNEDQYANLAVMTPN